MADVEFFVREEDEHDAFILYEEDAPRLSRPFLAV
jgi:hypothetical protein